MGGIYLMLWHYLLIGLGGAFGAMARVALGKILPTAMFNIPTFILFINIIGCFIMGFVTEILSSHGSISTVNIRYFLVSGLLGGFTTFSAFAFEFALLYEKSEYLLAIIYTALSVSLSLAAFFVGLKITKLIF
jgi:CrcB protein